MKKLNITFCSFPDYSSNAKALYEYMQKRYKDNMNYTWIVYNESTVTLLKEKNIKAILIGTEEFKKYIPTTDVFFTTQGNLDGDKVKTKNSIYIELWHGVGPKPSGFSQKNPSQDDIRGYGNIGEIVDYFIVPSEFWSVIFGATFKVEYSRMKTLGLPILDYFVHSNGKKNLEKILKLNLNKYKKIIMYMPTFKQGFNHNDIMHISNTIFNFKEFYSEDELNAFLKKNNYLLCVKKHPGEQADFNLAETENIKNIEEDSLSINQITVNEIMNAFDLLITDYSSIGTEFVFLDKPVLFVTGDFEEYQENRGILLGDFEVWTPGPKSDSLSSLMTEIKKLLSDENYYREERNKYKKIWFSDLKDGGCNKICDFLFSGNQLSKNVVRHKSKLLELQQENIISKEKIESQNQEIENQTKEIENLNKEMEYTKAVLYDKNNELASIYKSKGWKLMEYLRRIKRKLLGK